MDATYEQFNNYVDTNVPGTVKVLRWLIKRSCGGLPVPMARDLETAARDLQMAAEEAKKQLRRMPRNILEEYAAEFISGPPNPKPAPPVPIVAEPPNPNPAPPPPPAYEEEAAMPAVRPPPFEPSVQAKREELLKCVREDEWTTENALIPVLVSAEDPDILPRSIISNYQQDKDKKWGCHQFQVLLETKESAVHLLWKPLQAFKQKILDKGLDYSWLDTQSAVLDCLSADPKALITCHEILNQFQHNDLGPAVKKTKQLAAADSEMANLLYRYLSPWAKQDALRKLK